MFSLFKKSKLDSHKAALEILKENLFSNLFQDVWYETFPRIPAGTHKLVHTFGPYTVKQLLNCSQDTHSLVVRRNDVFLGTLCLSKSGFDVHGIDITNDTLTTLIDALLTCNEIDTRHREGCMPPPGTDMTNVVPLF